MDIFKKSLLKREQGACGPRQTIPVCQMVRLFILAGHSFLSIDTCTVESGSRTGLCTAAIVEMGESWQTLSKWMN